jgi:phosphocarrier protein
VTSPAGTSATRRSVVIVNKRGLHARAAARFVKLAATFGADISVARNGTTVSGGSIMGLMMLAAGPGTELVISGRGADAEAAVEALARLVGAGFDED